MLSECESCGKPLRHLIACWESAITRKYALRKDGSTAWSRKSSYDLLSGATFVCPHCGAELANSEMSAEEILKGETQP